MTSLNISDTDPGCLFENIIRKAVYLLYYVVAAIKVDLEMTPQ